jgi:hypothetical protein
MTVLALDETGYGEPGVDDRRQQLVTVTVAFMRNVKSRVLFEQMRGARCSRAALKGRLGQPL